MGFCQNLDGVGQMWMGSVKCGWGRSNVDGVGQMWMGLVRCGWGWSNVDGVGYFSSGVDNFWFEVMGTEGKEDIVPKGQHAMSEDHALVSLHITVPEYS